MPKILGFIKPSEGKLLLGGNLDTIPSSYSKDGEQLAAKLEKLSNDEKVKVLQRRNADLELRLRSKDSEMSQV